MSLQSPLYHDESRRLLFCTLCLVAIPPKKVDFHLKHRNHAGLDADFKRRLRTQYDPIDLVDPNSMSAEAITALFRTGPLPHVLLESGFRCPSCFYAVKMESSSRKHGCSHTDTTMVPCTVVRLSGRAPFAAVPPEFAPPSHTASPPASWATAVHDFEHAFSQAQSRPTVISPHEVGHIPIWDQRTGWLRWFHGVEMESLVPLCALHDLPDDRFSAVSTRDWIRRSFTDVHQRVMAEHQDAGGNILLRIVHAYSDTPFQQPLESIEEASLQQYIYTLEHVVLCILRCAAMPAEAYHALRIRLDPRQLRACQAILDLVPPTVAGPDPPPLWDIRLLDLYRSLIEQTLDTDTRSSPVLFALAILGWDTDRRRWHGPSHHTVKLSHWIYIIRIVALAHISNPTVCPPSERVERMHQYRRDYLTVGRPVLFDELQNQRNLGMNLNQDAYGRPSVTWEDSHQAVIVHGQRVELSRLRQFVAALIADAEQFLVHHLLFCTLADLHTIDPHRVVDNLAWADHGAHFVHLNPHLQQGITRMVTRLEQSPNHGPYHALHSRPLQDRLNAFHAYEDAVRRYLLMLGVLHLTCGGSPPRGTEITRLSWCNCATRSRSWYIIDGMLCAVYDYNKAEKNQKRPRVLARFYPSTIARLVVALMSEVFPFLHFLAFLAEQDLSSFLSPLIWHHDGSPLSSDTLKQELALRSGRHLGVDLNLATWRHLHIAINKALVELEHAPPGRTLAQCFALQAGHSLELEDHHYALSPDDLVGLSTKTLAAFKTSSRRWHQFLHIADPVPHSTGDSVLPLIPAPSPSLSSLATQLQLIQTQLAALRPSTPAPTDLAASAVPLPPRKRVRTTDDAVGFDPESSWDRILHHFHTTYGSDFVFRPQQEESIRTMLSPDCSRHLFVSLPTGGGKTLLIEASARAQPGQATVVVVPTISLKHDLLRRLRHARIDTQEFGGDLTNLQFRSVILVVMESTKTPAFRHLLQKLHSDRVLARTFWDEAHLIRLEGLDPDGNPGFRDWVTAVQTWPTDEQHVFLSATLPLDIQASILDILGVPFGASTTIKSPSQVPHLRYQVTIAPADSHPDLLLTFTRATPLRQHHTLVFVRSKAFGTQLAQSTGWPFYHGGISSKPSGQRMLEQFQHDAAAVLIATTAAAHGLNSPIDQVIICGLPYDFAIALQQAGRTGRHRVGRVIFLLDGPPPPPTAVTTKTLGYAALHAFLTTPVCRRHVIANYFHGSWTGFCRDGDVPCDVCQPRWNLPSSPADEHLDRLLDATSASPSAASPPSLGPVIPETSQPSPAIPIQRRVPAPVTPDPPSSITSPSGFSLPSHFSAFDSSFPSLPTASSLGFHSPTPAPSGVPPPLLLRDEQLWNAHAVRSLERHPPTVRSRFLTMLYNLECQLGVRCHLCWLNHRSDVQGHWFSTCPFSGPLSPDTDEKATVRQAVWRKSANLSLKNVHFHCFFPLTGCHPGGFVPQCVRNHLLWSIVEWAQPQASYASIFERHGCSSTSTVTDMAKALLSWSGQNLQLWHVVTDICQHRLTHSAARTQE